MRTICAIISCAALTAVCGCGALSQPSSVACAGYLSPAEQDNARSLADASRDAGNSYETTVQFSVAVCSNEEQEDQLTCASCLTAVVNESYGR
jgi:predicted molibdopterin-dependent oxidoreductase YjgC